MAKNLMICANAKGALRLNESETVGMPSGASKPYILEGVFAELDTLNRNQRIYPKNEYLKHLQYLRNDIKSGEALLGELDHPDDRFEVKLKEASHRVIDLWYDQEKNVVMGKIELLNTANGLLAKSLVDQGIPLHISSRAAGTVNSDNTVSIQQIYTYDLVCKPGFASAVLHRVNESEGAKSYTDDVKEYLKKSLKCESLNSAPQYGIVNENVSVAELSASAVLRKEAKDLQINSETEVNINDMNKPINEDKNPDSTTGQPLNISGAGEVPASVTGGATADNNVKEDDATPAVDNAGSGNKDNAKNESDDDEKDKDSKDDKDSDDKDDKDKDNDDDKIEIAKIEAEYEDDDKSDIKNIEAEHGDDEGDKGGDDDNKDGDDSEDESKRSPKVKPNTDSAEMVCDDKDTPKTEASKEEKEKADKEAEEILDKVKKDSEDKCKKLDDLIEKIQKNKEEKDKKDNVAESFILAQYPVSMMMNESNFAAFAALSESQKNKVVAYLQNNRIVTREGINESWRNGIEYVEEEPTWLKFAPQCYKSLYEKASPAVQENLATSAKYFIFESQTDINNFWENSGIDDMASRQLLNESFVKNMPHVATQPVEESLPYGRDFVQMIADMASEYNR